MLTFTDVSATALTWSQPDAFRRAFELRAGDDLVATLTWQKLFGSLALAEVAGSQWTFKREGFLSPRVSVRAAGSEHDLGTFRPGWTGSGTLQLTGGAAYRWAPQNFWATHWAWLGTDEQRLLLFKPRAALLKNEAALELAAPALADTPLLATLGWYLLVLYADDTAATAAAVTATM
jgi:hypothetical protein